MTFKTLEEFKNSTELMTTYLHHMHSKVQKEALDVSLGLSNFRSSLDEIADLQSASKVLSIQHAPRPEKPVATPLPTPAEPKAKAELLSRFWLFASGKGPRKGLQIGKHRAKNEPNNNEPNQGPTGNKPT